MPATPSAVVKGTVATLCPEVLYHIFLIAFDNNSFFATDTPYSQFPWNVSAVCHQWRIVCISRPKLWSKIFAVSKWHSCIMWGPRCVAPLGVIRCLLQLERSGSTPLIVDAKGIECGSSLSIVKAVARHAERIKALRYHPSDETWNRQDFDQCVIDNVRFRVMEYLDFSISEVEGDFPSEEGVLENFTLPVLKTLKLSRWEGALSHDMWIDSTETFPWTRLRAVHLNNYLGNTASILDLLQSCSGLEEFGISVVTPDTTREGLEVFRNIIIPLTNLTRFEVQVKSPHGKDTIEDLVQFLPFIGAPNLTHLALRGDERTCPYANLEFQLDSFLSRSACVVRSAELPLWNNEYGVPDMLPTSLRQVEQLVVHDGVGVGWNGDVLLRAMIDSHLLFPFLTHLRLIDLQVDPVLLVHVLESRQKTEETHGKVIRDVLVHLEIDHYATRSLEKNMPSGAEGGEMSLFVETVARAGLATCKINPSRVTFDPREFVTFMHERGSIFDDKSPT